jgi:hypothetical protein
MRATLFLLLGVMAASCGCGDKSSSSAGTTNANNPLTAPVDYLGAIDQAQRHAVKTVDAASINQAIQLFQAEHGRFPKDLNELVQERYLPHIPQAPHGTRIVYDANVGQARIIRQ